MWTLFHFRLVNYVKVSKKMCFIFHLMRILNHCKILKSLLTLISNLYPVNITDLHFRKYLVLQGVTGFCLAIQPADGDIGTIGRKYPLLLPFLFLFVCLF